MLENFVTALKLASAAPKPTYSIDGQSVSWGEYLKMLQEGIKATSELLGTFDPVEVRTSII
ncbi:hypothetical protein VT84_30665 [Gemmata sp. SH-PL17]|nr:hypothetical protein VT84_30665 [Gemmata sp. SH-PL17]